MGCCSKGDGGYDDDSDRGGKGCCSSGSRRNSSSGGCCSSCCCCCGKRGATVFLSLLGMIVAAGAIAPPVLVYTTDRDYQKLFPALALTKEFLRRATDLQMKLDDTGNRILVVHDENDGVESAIRDTLEYDVDENGPKVRGIMTATSNQMARSFNQDYNPYTDQSAKEKYRLAVFQLIEDIQSNSECLAFTSFVLGCINAPINLFLFFGAAFKFPCLMLPYLAVTLIELLVIGVPVVVFFGILSLYVGAQLHLYIAAGALIGVVVASFLISVSAWFAVHSCYSSLYRRGEYVGYPDGLGLGGGDPQMTQPLLQQQMHQNGSYQLGQYYPPHHQNRQLPNAPLYPNLQMA